MPLASNHSLILVSKDSRSLPLNIFIFISNASVAIWLWSNQSCPPLPSKNVVGWTFEKITAFVFLIVAAAAKTPPSADQSRQIELQKGYLRQSAARSAPIIIGSPTVTLLHPGHHHAAAARENGQQMTAMCLRLRRIVFTSWRRFITLGTDTKA
jgi:hypothetical protein